MRALYITAASTIILLTFFGLVISSVPSPLGGEPYSVVSLTDRTRLEAKLIKQATEAKLAARKEKKSVRTAGQDQPVYFKAEVDELALNREYSYTKEDFEKARLEKLRQQNDKLASIEELELLTSTGLIPAPVKELVENNRLGPLPRISRNGKRPQDIYARPANIVKSGRKDLKTIAILVTGLGLSKPMTDNSLDKLPGEISLAFNPYSAGLPNWVNESRKRGHELFLEMPMEPFDYPDNDPGPHTLLSNQTDKINIEHMQWIMSRMVGYIGIVNKGGGRFTAEGQALHPVMRELKDRGLIYMDSNPQSTDTPYQISQDMNLDYLQSNLHIDEIKAPDAIDNALKDLEKIATMHGTAIGVTTAIPLAIQRIEKWAESLEKRGFTLIPVSAAIARKQS